MTENAIKIIEEYSKQATVKVPAHGFSHLDHVRNWALKIAKEEGFEDLQMVEATALLHDIGLPFAKKVSMHGEIGARMASDFLRKNNLFDENKIEEIAHAIRHHNSNKKIDGKLLAILRDADMIDLFGAVGLMRCIINRDSNKEYNPLNVKGDAWQADSEYFDKRFDEGKKTGDNVIDQINFQISCWNNLNTETARKIAKPLIEYMKQYVLQFESEIKKAYGR